MTRFHLCALFLIASCHDAYREHAPDAGGVVVDALADAAARVVTPSNEASFGDLEANGIVAVPPDGTFDTENHCSASSILGACTLVARPGLTDACVCRAETITIGRLRIIGGNALVLFAASEITVNDMLDVSGGTGVQGPGTTAGYPASLGFYGGAGGSFGSVGGESHVVAMPIRGEPTLVPLVGGMAGQAGGGPYAGGGGGAVQLTAGERITIRGEINASGGGASAGLAAKDTAGGGGGGSGGAMLLEAPSVVITGAVVANGGGGGGGGGPNGIGGPGDNAGMPTNYMTGAAGGFGRLVGSCGVNSVVAGHGGYGATGTTPAQAGGPDVDAYNCIPNVPEAFGGGGGGGGGVGRIRINRITPCDCEGTILPLPTLGDLGTH